MDDVAAIKSFRETLHAAPKHMRSHVSDVVQDAITEYALETGMTAAEAAQMLGIVFNSEEPIDYLENKGPQNAKAVSSIFGLLATTAIGLREAVGL